MFNDEKMNFSVEARFGKTIVGKKWGVIPFALYLHQKELELDIHDVWFLTWLIMHKWTEKKPYPSIAKMSRITGKSESYIRSISKDLRERGYLLVEKRIRDDGGQNSNEYNLDPLFRRIEGLILNEPPLRAEIAIPNDEEELPPARGDMPDHFLDNYDDGGVVEPPKGIINSSNGNVDYEKAWENLVAKTKHYSDTNKEEKTFGELYALEYEPKED